MLSFISAQCTKGEINTFVEAEQRKEDNLHMYSAVAAAEVPLSKFLDVFV